MQATTRLLGICFVSFVWSGCHGVSKFDSPKKPANAQDLKPDSQDDDSDNSQDADAQQQALEPVAIGGAYLNCRFAAEVSKDEVWCRLEEDNQPVFVENASTKKWVFTHNSITSDAISSDLDRATGWQWAIKIPEGNAINISLDIFINGMSYHFDTMINAQAETDSSSTPATPVNLTNKYAYGGAASFVVDNNPDSLPPPQSCFTAGATTTPDPTLPNLRNFVKAQSFSFPFAVKEENSLVTIGMDEVCGQTRPIHYAELFGPGVQIKVQIPVGARKVMVIKNMALPIGFYQVYVHFIPRDLTDIQTPERFAFGKLILESDKQLTPGFAFGSK